MRFVKNKSYLSAVIAALMAIIFKVVLGIMEMQIKATPWKTKELKKYLIR